MPVIAIASEIGSEGNLIATQVARRLGLTLMDHSNVLDRLARHGFAIPPVGIGNEPHKVTHEKDWPLHKIGKIISTEILFLAQKNSMLLLSPYAPHLLAGIGHIPRILVCAPLIRRAKNFATTYDCNEAEARREIDLSETRANHILEACFGVELPSHDHHFDLVADTGWLGPQDWAEEIVSLVQDEDFLPTAASCSRLRALALNASVAQAMANGSRDCGQSWLPR